MGHGAAGLSGSSARSIDDFVVALPVASVSVSASVGTEYGEPRSNTSMANEVAASEWRRIAALLHVCASNIWSLVPVAELSRIQVTSRMAFIPKRCAESASHPLPTQY